MKPNSTRRQGALSKPGHVRVLHVPVAQLHPSPENDLLYKPVRDDDPETVALAESIRRDGVLEPLVITRDHYVLSGHRRLAAARLAGLDVVPCRVATISRGDGGDDFVRLLREHNRQRVKTLDEAIREEVVTASAADAHDALLRHRARLSVDCVKLEAVELKGQKRRHPISAAKRPMLQAALAAIDERRRFWPLTDRQVHYALLNGPPLKHASKPGSRYANDKPSYKDLTDLLTRARLQGLVPWGAINDPTRPQTCWDVHASLAGFVRGQLEGFLMDYWRDLLQSQPNHVEIVGEKNTVANIIRPVAADYCVPFMLGRGYSSTPPRYEMAQRYFKSGKEALVVLMLSDFDPEGEDIAHSFALSMRDDFGVDSLELIKVALTAEQVAEMALPPVMKAKADSSRYGKFVEQHGDDVFELEAVPPGELQRILREAIGSVLDRGAYEREVAREREESVALDRYRQAVARAIAAVGAGPAGG